MYVEELPIDSRIKKRIAELGITSLYPPQAEAIGPALRGKNVLMAVPTASGKSLVAYITMLDVALRGGKSIYIVPLRALAAEKYEDLLEFRSLGIRVGITVGDYDTPDPSLERFDIIVATSEKADSLLRHRSDWLHKIKVVVADEIHLINDADRGPTLEVTLAKFRQFNPDVQIIGLSATIGNSIELADWLGATHIKNQWRPVPLKEGVLLGCEIYYANDAKTTEIAVRGDAITALVQDSLEKGGQTLVFANTRKSSESVAEKCAKMIEKIASPQDKTRMEDISSKLSDAEDEGTSLGAKLSHCLARGTAFHHAGLTNSQRKVVERGFRDGSIRCICATPTLAAGINMPARRVIMKDLRRYAEQGGFARIPVLEIKQMCGRAGRPKYDREGEAIFIASSDEEREDILDRYIFGEPEDITSKLGAEPALRTHILAAIATEHVKSRAEILSFIDKTFFSYRRSVDEIEDVIDSVINFMKKEELVSGKETLSATSFGKRVSDLYIDPLSATRLRDALRQASWKTDSIGYFHAICSTPDVVQLYLRRNDAWVEKRLIECQSSMLMPVPDPIKEQTEYEFFLSQFKTACVLEDWVNEVSEDLIVDRYFIGPGDIRTKVETGRWLAYSMTELSRLFNSSVTRQLNQLVTRVQSGAKEELLDLIRLEGVGRKRARALFSKGIKTVDDVRKTDMRALSEVPGIGERLAVRIKDEAHAGRVR